MRLGIPGWTVQSAVCKKLENSFPFPIKKRELNLSEQSLKTECPTRWGSRQAMIDRVLEQHTAIAQVLSSARKLRHLTFFFHRTLC